MAKQKRQVVSDASDAPKKEIGPRDENGLTHRQAAFVLAFTSGKTAGNGVQSVIAAGYGTKNPGPMACALQKLSHVQAAIDRFLREEIGSTLTIEAIKVIRAIITDKNAPLKLRGEMAAKVVEFSGIVDRVKLEKARETGLDGAAAGPKRLGEMTRQELESLVQNGAAILSAAAALPAVTIEGSISKKVGKTVPSEAAKPLLVNGFAP